VEVWDPAHDCGQHWLALQFKVPVGLLYAFFYLGCIRIDNLVEVRPSRPTLAATCTYDALK